MHAAVTVCVKNIDDLHDALAPFDADRSCPAQRRFLPNRPRNSSYGSLVASVAGRSPEEATWPQLAAFVQTQHEKYCHGESFPKKGFACPTCGLDPIRFDEQGRAYLISTGNEQGKWDSWSPGGRFIDSLLLKPGFADDPRVFRPEEAGAAPAGAVRGILDLARMRERARVRAEADWDGWVAATAGFPPPQSLRTLVGQPRLLFSRNLGPAIQQYRAQPAVRAASRTLGAGFLEDPVEVFGDGRDAFLAGQMDAAVSGAALLTVEGAWLEPAGESRDGVEFAIVDRRAFYREAAAYLSALADDVWVVVVDTHAWGG